METNATAQGPATGPYVFACDGVYDGFRPGKDGVTGYMTMIVGDCLTSVFRVTGEFVSKLAVGDAIHLEGNVMQRSFGNTVVIEHRPTVYRKTGPYEKAAAAALKSK